MGGFASSYLAEDMWNIGFCISQNVTSLPFLTIIEQREIPTGAQLEK